MNFRTIEFGTDDYRRECVLRDQILRAPLGLSLYSEDLEAERHQLHFGLFSEEGALQACAMAVPQSDTQAKIRQMAVSQERQGNGWGRILMLRIEGHLRERGIRRCVLHARVTAEGFYKKLGYESVGERFLEVTIPHIKMQKEITA